MAKAFVYSILAALLFAVHSTTAFNLSVHDTMTEAERLAYGFEDSGSEYNVFPMSLTGMGHKQKARENIHCTLELNSETIKLNLKPISHYLATKYIPVWLARSDRRAYNNIHYTPLPTAMSDIGEFTMYHDFENLAALVVYKDRSEKIVIEGIISWDYIIRSVPKRFINNFENVVTYMSKIPNMMGGAITSYEDTGFYAVIRIPPEVFAGPYHRAKPENVARQKRAKSNERKRKVPKKIFPECLLVLDYNAIRYRTITQALRFTLATWNGIGVLVHLFDEPKVRPNIAGIIIAKDDKATPYITEDTSVLSIGAEYTVIPKMRRYFYEERYRLPVKQYDLIVAMTTLFLPLCIDGSCKNDRFFPLYGDPSLNCSSERDIMRAKAVNNTYIVYYDTNFGLLQFIGIWHYFVYGLMSTCVSANRRRAVDDNYPPPKCFQKTYSAIFTNKEIECYRNKPLSIQPVDKVVPGRWLSMDGQCQNEGFAKSCKLKNKIRACKEKGCRSKGSKKCVRSKQVPLLGSKCGTNKRCNNEKRCVKKL